MAALQEGAALCYHREDTHKPRHTTGAIAQCKQDLDAVACATLSILSPW